MLSILLVQDLHPLGSFKQLTVPSLAMCVLDDVGVCACVFQIRLRFSFYSPFYCCISQFIISFFFSLSSILMICYGDLLFFVHFFFFTDCECRRDERKTSIYASRCNLEQNSLLEQPLLTFKGAFEQIPKNCNRSKWLRWMVHFFFMDLVSTGKKKKKRERE